MNILIELEKIFNNASVKLANPMSEVEIPSDLVNSVLK